MATTKKQAKKPSSGSDPKSKRIVKNKVQQVMHEFKHHDLESGRSGQQVRNPKQAIAIALSEARRAGADVPPPPNQKASAKKTAAKKTASEASTKKAPAKKAASAKETTAKKSSGRK